MRILLTGAEGDIAEAVCRILNESFAGIEVHGSDLSGDTWPTHAGFRAVHKVPKANTAEYLDTVRALHAAHHFDLIIPVTGAELRAFASNDSSGLPLLMVRADLVLAFLDKLETTRWLAAHALPAPETRTLEEARASSLPLLLKPRDGHGSRGIAIVRTAEELESARRSAAVPMVAQEYLPGDDAEFTCGVYRHAASGETRTITFRRRLAGGLTGRAAVERHDTIEGMLHDLAEAAKLDGSINVQLRLTEAGPRVFEINPRFSSTAMMRHRLGFRDVVWSLEGRQGVAPPAYRAPAGARVFRLSRELVIDPPSQSHA